MARLQDEWIAGNGMGSYVGYYNPTGHVMEFVSCPTEARRTTDPHEARTWARIANTLYGRTGFSLRMAPDRD